MKTIVTHKSPDIDAICAVWLFRKHVPGWSNSTILFTTTGKTIDGKAPDHNPNVVHVDTGLGKFDHHQNDDYTSASQKVLEYVIKNGWITKDKLLAYERLINMITAFDHFKEAELPNADNDMYHFLLVNILDGVKVELQDDLETVRIGSLMMEGALNVFLQIVKAEDEIRAGYEFASIYGKSLSYNSNSDQSSRLAQKKGFNLVIRKDDKGHVRLKLHPKLKREKNHITLKPVYDEIIKRDKTGTWFYHASGHMVLNGASGWDTSIPTSLSTNEIIKIVKSVKTDQLYSGK